MQKTIFSRTLSVILSVAMLIGIFQTASVTAFAETFEAPAMGVASASEISVALPQPHFTINFKG